MSEEKIDSAVKFARRAAKVTFDDLKPEEIASAKRSITDCIGVMIAGASLGYKVKDVAKYIQMKGGAEEATLIGYGGKYPTNAVAMANGGFAHTMDYDDAAVSGSHPTASTVPISLAFAERKGGVSGKEFITAVTVGNDLLVRLSNSTPQVIHQGWLGPMIKGGFAAALAGSKILGLDEDQMVSALGIALTQASGSSQVLDEAGNDIRELYQCFAAKSGVFSAEMAEMGIKGCRESFDGRDGFFNDYFRARTPEPEMEWMDVDDDSPFLTTQAVYKPYSSCLCTHYFIDALRQIMAGHPEVTKDTVAEMHVYVAGTAEMLCQPEEGRMSPVNGNDARFSIPFTLGCTLAYGRPTLANFTPEGIKDPLARELAHKVTWEHSDYVESLNLGVGPGIMDVILKDGTKLSGRCDSSLGNLDNPIPDADMEAKFRDCCKYSVKKMDEKSIDELLVRLHHLEDLEDVTEIIQYLA